MPIQHLLFVYLVIIHPVRTAVYTRRVKLGARRPDRIRAYKGMIAWQWAAVAILLVAVGWRDLFYSHATEDLGRLPGQSFLVAVFLLLVVGVFVHHIYSWSRPGRRRRLAEHLTYLDYFLPGNAEERRWWVLVGLTAGVCEEVLFRGFMIDYLHRSFGLSSMSSWALASLLFGLGHAYQRWRSVVGLTVFGAALGMVFFEYGSLLVPILVHAFWDLRVLLFYPLRDASDARAGHAAGGRG